MGKMNILVEIDPSFHGSEVIIRTDQRTGDIDRIIEAIEKSVKSEQSQVTAWTGSTMALLSQHEIFRVYTGNRKLIICTEKGEYESRLPLRDLEETLSKDSFARISRFEIINLDKVSGFDFSVTGTIQVLFDNGSSTWVSRRYVKTIQQTLSRLQTGRRDDQ